MSIYGTLINLVIDATFSWGRMFAALGISIALAVGFGVWAATARAAERIILPVMDILQTLPILAFFPFVLLVFAPVTVTGMENYLGVNAAVIFLIVTSMLWNIVFGVYEAIRSIPKEFLEVAQLYRMGIWQKLKRIFVPAALPRIVQQSILSWSIGLFYLVTSEIFSYGTATCCSVQHGIGAFLVQYSPSISPANWTPYLLGIGVFIVFVVLTRFLFFKPLEDYASRYTRTTAKATAPARIGTFVNWFSRNLVVQPLTTIRYVATPKNPAATKGIEQKATKAREGRPVPRWTYYIVVLAVLSILFTYAAVIKNAILANEYQILVALAFSFARVWIAFAVITVIVLPLCVYLVFISKQSSKYLLFFQVLASIPGTILLPGIAIALAGFPYHAELVAFVIFLLAGIWYPIFSIMGSTKTIPASVMEVKALFRIRGWSAWKNFYLKAIVPGFITGALTGIAAEWNASIVAECFTTNGLSGGASISCVGTGIGKLLDSTVAPPGDITLLLVALLNLVVMILLINTFVWKRRYRNIAKIYG